MKKVTWISIWFIGAVIMFFLGVMVGPCKYISVAGAEERQNVKEPIYNEIRKLEERIMIPHYIDIVDCPPCPEPEKDCGWEYKIIEALSPRPVPCGEWEPIQLFSKGSGFPAYVLMRRRVCD